MSWTRREVTLRPVCKAMVAVTVRMVLFCLTKSPNLASSCALMRLSSGCTPGSSGPNNRGRPVGAEQSGPNTLRHSIKNQCNAALAVRPRRTNADSQTCTPPRLRPSPWVRCQLPRDTLTEGLSISYMCRGAILPKWIARPANLHR